MNRCSVCRVSYIGSGLTALAAAAVALTGVAVLPGASAWPAAAAWPGAATQTGVAALPGAAAWPGAAAQTGAGASPGATTAPGVNELQITGQVGGNVMDADVAGTEAHLTVGPRLQVWDVEDPAHPALRWQSPIMGHMLGQVAVSDERAYALEVYFEEADEPTACYGVRAFDTGAGHPPRPGGWLPCPAAVNDIDAAGRVLVLATSEGVTVVDAGDVSVPTVLGQLPGVRSARSVRISGDHVFVAGEPDDTPGGSALLVYSSSTDVLAPPIGRLDLTVRTAAIDVDGDHVFVVSRACSAEVGLEVIDVGDPTAPKRLGFRPLTCGILDVAAFDNAAHVLGFDYENMIESVFVFDVTDPAEPRPEGVVATPFGRSMAKASGHVLVSAAAGGTHVVDVRRPAEAQVVTRLPTLGDVADVGLDGDTAYATNSVGELWAVRIEHPGRPHALSATATGAGAGALALHGGHAYVAQPDNTWSERAGIHVVDVSHGPEPETIGFLEIVENSDEGELLASPAPEQMDLDGDWLYVPTGRYGAGPVPGLWRVDVSSPAAPQLRAFYPHDADVYAVSASGPTAYVAAGDRGLDVVRLGEDGEVEPVGNHPTAGPAVHTALGESILSVATDRGGVRLLRLSDAGVPVEVGAVEGVTVTSTAFAAGELFVPGRWTDRKGSAGLRVFDVADPSTPNEVAAAALPAPGRVAARDGLVAIAAGRLGLLLVTDRPAEDRLFFPACGR